MSGRWFDGWRLWRCGFCVLAVLAGQSPPALAQASLTSPDVQAEARGPVAKQRVPPADVFTRQFAQALQEMVLPSRVAVTGALQLSILRDDNSVTILGLANAYRDYAADVAGYHEIVRAYAVALRESRITTPPRARFMPSLLDNQQ